MTDEIRSYGPGKFSTVMDEFIYKLSLEYGVDEEHSYPDGGGWWGLFRGPFFLDTFGDDNLSAIGIPNLNSAEQEFICESASSGAIMHEDSQGLVEVDYFSNEEELEFVWSLVEGHFLALTEEDQA